MNLSEQAPRRSKFQFYAIMTIGAGLAASAVLSMPGWLLAEAVEPQAEQQVTARADRELLQLYRRDPTRLTGKEYRAAMRELDHQQQRQRKRERERPASQSDPYRVWRDQVDDLEAARKAHPPGKPYSARRLIEQELKRLHADAPQP